MPSTARSPGEPNPDEGRRTGAAIIRLLPEWLEANISGATTHPQQTARLMSRPEPTSEHDPRLKQAIGMLHQAGYRVTRPRIRILNALIDEGDPIKIEDLHQRVRANNCDLATVYRCIAAFEKIGIVRRCFFPDGTSLFEFVVGSEHHHHIICTSCRKVESLDVCVVAGLERLVRDRGYRKVSHMLEFFGVCRECSEKNGKP